MGIGTGNGAPGKGVGAGTGDAACPGNTLRKSDEKTPGSPGGAKAEAAGPSAEVTAGNTVEAILATGPSTVDAALLSQSVQPPRGLPSPSYTIWFAA